MSITIAQRRVALEDPHNSTDSADVLNVFDALFDALVRRGADGGYLPALAESWEVSADARTWTFHLRKGVKFHSGDPVDALAVEYCLRRMARPDMGVTLGAPGVYSQYLTGADVNVPDNKTVRITTVEPLADLLDILVCGYILPPDLLARDAASFAKKPVGSGPYQIVSYSEGEEIVVRRFEGYWGDRPPHDQITWRAYAAENDRLAALKSGEVDIATRLHKATMGKLPEGLTICDYLDPTTYIYLLNTTKPPFDDPRLRKAINMAIDRPAVIANVLSGDGDPLTGFISPAHFGFDNEAAGIEFDPVAAKALLAAAGYCDGLEIELDCPTSLPDEAESLSAEISRQLLKIGINVTVHTVQDRTAYAHQVRRKEIHDLCVFDSSPISTFRVLREKIDARTNGSWWQGYHKVAVEDLLDQACETVDEPARLEIYRQCYRLLQEDPAWLYLYNHRYVTGLRGNHPDWRMPNNGILDVRSLAKSI